MRRRPHSPWIASLLLAGMALLAGCLTVGRDFPAQQVRKLEIGSTTRDQVRDLFGDPWRVGVEDGDPTWTYGHYRYSLIGNTRTRDLLVRFDPRGVVSSYTFSSTDPRDEIR
jgi:outer membrane protein assembly factor BamE (lipoprotein component of BamABCDE complex)